MTRYEIGKRFVTEAQCTKCGNELTERYRSDIWDGEDEGVCIVYCSSCDIEYDWHDKEYYAYFVDMLNDEIDEDSFFHLGLKGTIHDIDFEITGRIRYMGEDGEETVWEKWIAAASGNTSICFFNRSEEITINEEYVPESMDLEINSTEIEFEEMYIKRAVGYIGHVIQFEGQLSREPEIGDPVLFYNIEKDGSLYSIEKSVEEVFVTKCKSVGEADIIKW